MGSAGALDLAGARGISFIFLNAMQRVET